ncbi:MAG TPA: MFS transporter [Candidatus Acidoferrales bacterium]|nr:MFS transporter [Candidatus Acidoferrales bacterium]
MRARTPNPFALALFWLGLQTVWGALLGISLQARTLQLVSSDALVAYGHLAALGASVAALTQIGVGFWTDARRRQGSRRIEFYASGAIAGAVAIAAFYEAPTFAWLTLAYVALQASLNVAIGPYQAVIPDFVETRSTGVASSWMAALQSIGNALGAIFASTIADARALAGAVDAVLLATCAATCLHVGRLVPRSQPPPARLTVSREFVDLFVSRAFIYVGFFTLVGYLLFYVDGVPGAKNLAAARLQSGILILIFTLVGAAGAAVAAKPSDRLDRRLVATVGAVLMAAALATFIAAHTIALAAAATCLAGLGWGVFLVADWALACRVMPAGAAATGMGIWNLALVLPQIAAPLLTTAVLQRAGLTGPSQGPRAAFALAIGETFVGTAWLWRLSRCAERE